MYIQKVEPISTKYRKGAVILVNGKEVEIEPAIFAGKDLLKKPRAEYCEILHWPDADGGNQPSPTNKNMAKIAELADKLNNSLNEMDTSSWGARFS